MSLPKGYEPPKSDLPSDYTELEAGETRLRVLSDFITGNMYWIEVDGKRKPVRKHDDEEIDVSQLGVDKWGNPETVKPFMAAIVWNYGTKKIEIFEANKFAIVRAIYDLETDPDWGDTKGYDIGIVKSGEGKQTRYEVRPKPAKTVAPEILEARKNKPIRLEALYLSENPFDVKMMDDKAVEDVSDDIPF